MRKTWVCCFLVLYLSLYVAATSSSEYQFIEDINGWVRYHRLPATWQDARLQCQLEGAILASPLNETLLSIMTEVMQLQDPPQGLFTGIHATFAKGLYFSIEGVPVAKVPVLWAPGQPDNHLNSEACLLLHPNATLADVPCGDVAPYVCYKKRTKNMKMNACGTFDNEYRLEPRTGSCYKFHNTPTTWSRAFRICTAEEAYLAIANSDAEVKIFSMLADEYARKLGTPLKVFAHLGFYNWGDSSAWVTIHGDTLEQAGYSRWAHHEPSNFSGPITNYEGESCGSMYIHPEEGYGYLNDLWCGDVMPFVCEKEIDN